MADSRHIDSNENKQLLWGILLDEGVFNGIPSNNVKEVQSIFETTINELKGNTNATLIEQNMTVIQKLLVDIPIYAKLLKSQTAQHKSNTQPHLQPPPIHPSHSQTHLQSQSPYFSSQMLPSQMLPSQLITEKRKMPELELIYSEDTRREKYTEIENKMKQQQQNMRQMLDLPKPPAVDFADDFQDKPLGDDMDRIIQETIAARERDLELINKAITAGGGGGGDRDTLPVQVGVIRPVPPVVTDATLNVSPNNAPNNADNTNTNERKKVSFSDVNQEYMPLPLPLQQEQPLSQIQEIINEIKQEQANMRLLFENMKSQIENIQNKLSFGL